jgi:hypothetical protein
METDQPHTKLVVGSYRSMLGCHKRPTQSLHMPPEWFVAVDFEPFGNCFSTTDYDCAGESTYC